MYRLARFLALPVLVVGIAAGLLAVMPGFDTHLLVPVKPAPPQAPAQAPGSLHDSAKTGSIAGQVTWGGEIPQVPPLLSVPNPLDVAPGSKQYWPNPHTPQIDPTSHGVRNAVVFLRGVDPARARPWHHPSVQVEARAHQFHVIQGSDVGQVGFVQQGSQVQFVARDDDFEMVQGRGDAFFGLPLTDKDHVLSRVLDRPGVVELVSGAGHFWTRAYLFVADHPYFTRPDQDGRFLLAQVPPGEYELVCWLPDWREASHEYDGDTSRVWRMTFQPAQERVTRVRVEAGHSLEVPLVLPPPPDTPPFANAPHPS